MYSFTNIFYWLLEYRWGKSVCVCDDGGVTPDL